MLGTKKNEIFFLFFSKAYCILKPVRSENSQATNADPVCLGELPREAQGEHPTCTATQIRELMFLPEEVRLESMLQRRG